MTTVSRKRDADDREAVPFEKIEVGASFLHDGLRHMKLPPGVRAVKGSTLTEVNALGLEGGGTITPCFIPENTQVFAMTCVRSPEFVF